MNHRVAILLCAAGILGSWCVGCRDEAVPPAPPAATPTETGSLAPVGEAANLANGEKAGKAATTGKPGLPAEGGKGGECNPAGHVQTGNGCDMEGIRAAVRSHLGPGGPVQQCYRKHLWADPKEGKVLVRFSLTPDGRSEGLQAVQDDLDSPEMVECLFQVLGGVRFPAPGDVPCQVVYPFSFFPRGSR